MSTSTITKLAIATTLAMTAMACNNKSNNRDPLPTDVEQAAVKADCSSLVGNYVPTAEFKKDTGLEIVKIVNDLDVLTVEFNESTKPYIVNGEAQKFEAYQMTSTCTTDGTIVLDKQETTRAESNGLVMGSAPTNTEVQRLTTALVDGVVTLKAQMVDGEKITDGDNSVLRKLTSAEIKDRAATN